MMALLAQAASSGEWYDGWQLAVVTFTSLTIVAGWIHRQSKSDLKGVRDDLTANIAEVKTDLKLTEARLREDIAEVKTHLKLTEARLREDIAEVKTDLKLTEARLREDITKVGDDLKDLKDKLYDDARSQVSMYQWQLAATQPATSEGTPQQSSPQPKQLAETTSD